MQIRSRMQTPLTFLATIPAKIILGASINLERYFFPFHSSTQSIEKNNIWKSKRLYLISEMSICQDVKSLFCRNYMSHSTSFVPSTPPSPSSALMPLSPMPSGVFFLRRYLLLPSSRSSSSTIPHSYRMRCSHTDWDLFHFKEIRTVWNGWGGSRGQQRMTRRAICHRTIIRSS